MTCVPVSVSADNLYGFRQSTPLFCRYLCCQPNIDKDVYNYEEQFSKQDELYHQMTILEDSRYCGRAWSFCNPGCRPTKYIVHRGRLKISEIPSGSLDYPLVMTHEKGCSIGHDFPCIHPALRLPCCCDLPYLFTRDEKGNLVGKTQYVCNPLGWCAPHFDVSDSSDQVIYRVKADTCCCGCFVKPRCSGRNRGAKCCRVPFLIRSPITNRPIEDAHVSELWTGWEQMCCTRRMMYRVKFPPEANPAMRVTLMGTALLIDLAVFEQRIY